jgi:hypothetical protein
MSDNKPQVYAYRAVCEHGKTRALVVDEPAVMKDCAKDIAEWLKDGLRLERVMVEEARKSEMHCDPCDEKCRPRKKRKEPEAQSLFANSVTR